MLRKLVFAALVCAALSCHPCPACNQAQCNAAPCTASDPYYCVSGPSAGGCGPNSDTWNNTKLCTACCDTSNCSSTRFSCGSCTQAQCESPNRCSLLAPYMCTNGSSSWGCATTANFWPAQHMCDGCCDVTSCVSSCTPCTVQQCQANPCSPSFPYVCTAGPLKNGCSNSSSYFPDQSQCFACCDASACATPAPQTPAPPTRDPAA